MTYLNVDEEIGPKVPWYQGPSGSHSQVIKRKANLYTFVCI